MQGNILASNASVFRRYVANGHSTAPLRVDKPVGKAMIRGYESHARENRIQIPLALAHACRRGFLLPDSIHLT